MKLLSLQWICSFGLKGRLTMNQIFIQEIHKLAIHIYLADILVRCLSQYQCTHVSVTTRVAGCILHFDCFKANSWPFWAIAISAVSKKIFHRFPFRTTTSFHLGKIGGCPVFALIFFFCIWSPNASSQQQPTGSPEVDRAMPSTSKETVSITRRLNRLHIGRQPVSKRSQTSSG